MKSHHKSTLRVVISGILIFVLLYLVRGEYGKIFDMLKKTDLLLLSLALVGYVVNIALNTLRLKALLQGEKIKMAFLRLMEFSYIGFFFNNFMPSAIGGDIVKAYYAGKITGEKSKTYMSVFMDRLTGIFSFATLGILALFLNWNSIADPIIKRSVLFFVLLCTICGIATLNTTAASIISKLLTKIPFKKISELFIKVYNMLHAYKDKKGVLIKAIGISMLAQTSYFCTVFVLCKAIGIELPFKIVFLIMPLVSIISLTPSLGGLGVREGAIVALFGPLIGKNSAFGLGIILYGVLLSMSLIGGLIYLLSPQFRLDKIESEALFDR